MISDEELTLWHQARSEPGALEVYMDWLLIHDPPRGRGFQERMRGQYPSSWGDTSYEDMWFRVLGLEGAKSISCNPLPSHVSVDVYDFAKFEPFLEKLAFLHIMLDCYSGVSFEKPMFAKIRALSLFAMTESVDQEENYQSTIQEYHGESVLQQLLASPLVPQLEELGLPGQKFGAQCAAKVAAAPFRNLRELYISDEPIGNEGAIAIATSPALATLRKLTLNTCQVGDAGAFAIAASPHLTQLEELTLNNWIPIGAECVAVLRARGYRKLEVIQPERG